MYFHCLAVSEELNLQNKQIQAHREKHRRHQWRDGRDNVVMYLAESLN